MKLSDLGQAAQTTTQTIQTGGGSSILATTAPSVLAPTTSGAKVFIPATVFVQAGKMDTGTPTQTVTSGPAVVYQSVNTIQPQQAAGPSPAAVSSGGQVATTISTAAPPLAPVAVRGATPGAPMKVLAPAGAGLKQPVQVATQKPVEQPAAPTPAAAPTAQPSTAIPWVKYGLVVFGVLAVGYALTKKK